MLEYEHHETREDWLAARGGHIGASEAASIMGYSKWQTPAELWRIKTGKQKPKDLSDNPNVKFGTKSEEHIRGLFMCLHPELRSDYRPYDFLYQDSRPWLRATLDGELTEIATGERGILEIKSAECISKADWDAWNGKIPQNYFCQILHQFAATGFTFAYLCAFLYNPNGRKEIKEYLFLREDFETDITNLVKTEEVFWKKVQTKNVPSAILRL